MYSWTNREYQNFLKGAYLFEADELERFSIAAIFNARAANEKRITSKKLFNADKVRKKINKDESKQGKVYSKEETEVLRKWFKNYQKS